MTNLLRIGALLAALSFNIGAYAGDIQVEGAWSRATAPGQADAMADLAITSKQAATLVGISSAACKSVELHSMTHEGGVMKMREVKTLELPAGKRVSLSEGGYHLMLIGLKAPLKAGEAVPLTLKIKTAGKREVSVEAKAEVKPLAEPKAEPAQDEHAHHMHH
ncbi:MAG TPA: copper chaperone PCu(A)C [Gallionella sp.]|nr:copper chaperone PCu(A)C [Gallionella sp.]